MVRLDTPLAKTIEQRMLATLRRSKYGYMTFWELVTRSKCERWLELCKHVYGSMEYRYLVESPTAGNIVALCRTHENNVHTKGEINYKEHLETIQTRLKGELYRVNELLKKTKTA